MGKEGTLYFASFILITPLCFCISEFQFQVTSSRLVWRLNSKVTLIPTDDESHTVKTAMVRVTGNSLEIFSRNVVEGTPSS